MVFSSMVSLFCLLCMLCLLVLTTYYMDTISPATPWLGPWWGAVKASGTLSSRLQCTKECFLGNYQLLWQSLFTGVEKHHLFLWMGGFNLTLVQQREDVTGMSGSQKWQIPYAHLAYTASCHWMPCDLMRKSAHIQFSSLLVSPRCPTECATSKSWSKALKYLVKVDRSMIVVCL